MAHAIAAKKEKQYRFAAGGKMMRKTHRILIAALAAFIAFAGIGYGNVGAESNNADYAADQLLLLNNEVFIPEDFPNIFTSYSQRKGNLEQNLDYVEFAEISVNGRVYMFAGILGGKSVRALNVVQEIGKIVQGPGGNSIFEFNDKFFDKNDYVRFINIRSFVDTLEYLNIDINADSLSQLKNCLENHIPMTINDFIEIYKMIIPREMLPIKLETPQININPTIPKFTEEFLNKPFDIKKLSAIAITGNKPEPSLIEFCEPIGEMTVIDYVTCIKLHNVFSREFELDSAFADKSNIVKEKGFDKKKYSFRYSIEIGFSLQLVGEHYPAMVEPLLAVKTYGDLLEVYQMLPLEVQRQYKESDFKDNPYVDPAWWAERPYVELSVGSSGREVLALKQRFYELGYFRTTSFNDRFTDSTADTVRLFEKNNDLPVDGVADAGMLGVLFTERAVGK